MKYFRALRARGYLWQIACYGALALLYIAFLSWQVEGHLYGDEWRYTYYAKNLVRGYYSPPEVTFLWNGPGYPLWLTPIAAFKLPWMYGRYANVLLLLGAVAYFCHTVRLFASARRAALAGLLLGLYPPLIWHLHLLYSELLAAFLITAFAYHYLRALGHPARAGATEPDTGRIALHTGLAALWLAALALTKVLFGPALVVWGTIALLWFAIRRARALARTAAIAALALLFCTPYLAYTYQLTGRPFYWASATGMSLYFMSSPYPGELGDWYNQRQIRTIPELRKNHRPVLDQIGRFREVPKSSSLGELHFLGTDEADAEFRRLAMQNIREYPVEYLKNWVANVARLFFDTPFSYRGWHHDPGVYAINGLLLALLVVSLGVAWRKRRFDRGVVLLLGLAVIALGGNSTISAVGRYSAPIMPLVGLFIVFVLFRAPPDTDKDRRPS